MAPASPPAAPLELELEQAIPTIAANATPKMLRIMFVPYRAGLSTDADVYFYLNTLDQEGANWNDFENVQPDVTVVANWGGYPRACHDGAGAYWESTYWLSYVSWSD